MRRNDSRTAGLVVSRLRSVSSTRIEDPATSYHASARRSRSTKDGSSQRAGRHVDRHPAQQRALGRGPAGRTAATASSNIRASTSTMSPVSSATSMKCSGTTSPRSPSLIRASASDADDPAVRQVDDRLEERDQQVLGHRAAQQALRLQPRHRLGPQRVVEECVLVAAGVLRAVEREVGLAEEVARRAVGGLGDRDADAHGRDDGVGAGREDVGRRRTLSSRTATACTSLGLRSPSTSTTNSSPPSRATVASARLTASIRLATSTSRASPTWWPSESLTA